MKIEWESAMECTTEEKRILSLALAHIYGVHYEPIYYAKMNQLYYFVAYVEIDGIENTGLVALYVGLNSSGKYQVKKVIDLLPKKNQTIKDYLASN